MLFRLENRSGYDTGDLYRLVARGLSATKTPTRGLRVVISTSPIYSRGCAVVGGHRMHIAIASPARFSLRRLARLIEHEAAHLRGVEHEQMDKRVLYSMGKVPDWAKGMKLRYRGRAPSQLPFLRNQKRGEKETFK